MSKIVTGKVLRATRATYEVMVDHTVLQCTIRGKLSVENPDYRSVRVGDNVTLHRISDGEGVIESVLPRTSQIERNIESRQYQKHIFAVNIDQLLIILSTKKPAFKSGLLDRYLVISEKYHIPPIICINKMDLSEPEDFLAYQHYYSKKLNYPLMFTSAQTGEGIDSLTKLLKNRVSALVGHSGVGKSSIIQAIQPELDIRTASISERTSKGLHTTTHSQLFPLEIGGFVMDTPGVRELGLWDIYKKDLSGYFVDFAEVRHNCQFADCTHIHEPGCAVKAAVESGDIFAERYENYCNIFDSLKSADQQYHYR